MHQTTWLINVEHLQSSFMSFKESCQIADMYCMIIPNVILTLIKPISYALNSVALELLDVSLVF